MSVRTRLHGSIIFAIHYTVVLQRPEVETINRPYNIIVLEHVIFNTLKFSHSLFLDNKNGIVFTVEQSFYYPSIH